MHVQTGFLLTGWQTPGLHVQTRPNGAGLRPALLAVDELRGLAPRARGVKPSAAGGGLPNLPPFGRAGRAIPLPRLRAPLATPGSLAPA